MGDVCAGRTSMFQDLVRLLAIKKSQIKRILLIDMIYSLLRRDIK